MSAESWTEIARRAAGRQGLAAALLVSGCISLRLPAGDGGPQGKSDAALPDAGLPAARLLAPPPDVAAPTNLARVVVAFPAPLPSLDVSLADSTGAAIPSVARVPAPDDPVCAGEQEGACVSLELDAPLPPASHFHVVLGPTIAGVAGASALAFTTGTLADGVPPTASFTTERSDGCVVLRLVADEPVWAELTIDPIGAGGERHEVAPGLGTAVELAHPFGGDLPGDYDLTITLTDLAGNIGTLAPDPITAPAPSDWALSEVLANPVGPEPRQEWIEVERVASTPGSLAGLAISDGAGQDTLPDVAVMPGQRALIVPSSYDETAPGDVAPAPGTPLARLDNDTIGSGGLSNRGETVTLLDPSSGMIVSTFTAYYDTSAPSWAGRSIERVYVGSCDVRANALPNANHRATPGAKNSVEP
jgi:hypothetical protein